MDILQFLNSKDVANYLREINYSLSPEQVAYIIYDSKNHTVAQKQAAWNELINTNGDYILKGRHRDMPDMPLGAFLQKFLNLQNKLIEECESGRGVYTFEYLSKDDGYWIDGGGYYNGFDKCLSAVKEEFNNDELLKIRITKSYFNTGRYSHNVQLELLPSGEITKVDANYLTDIEYNIFSFFEWEWIDIPTPFKRGDIVKLITPPYKEKSEEWENVFVLNDIVNWGGKKLKENGYTNGKGKRGTVDFAWRNKHIWRLKKDGDATDMYACGYGVLKGGEVFYDCFHTYLNMEYYRGELVGNMGILKAISSYEKGDICEELLLNAYLILRQKNILNEVSTGLDCFTDEAKKLAGLL